MSDIEMTHGGVAPTGALVYVVDYFKLVDPTLGDTRRCPDSPDYIDTENTERFAIGIFSSREKADEVVEKLAVEPGFRDDLAGFYVSEQVIDSIGWSEGFVTVYE